MPGHGATGRALVVSGLTEVAVGALLGWPYAAAISSQTGRLPLGIRSAARLRQWHLDLVSLGTLTALAGVAVPNAPVGVAWPLAVGAWTNASAFGVLAFRPELHEHPAYRAGVACSFALTSWGVTALAARAWLADRPHRAC